jgi:hypothetical protein
MDIPLIYEYCEKSHTIVIRTGTPAHSLAYFEHLFLTAKGDFPLIREEDVKCKKYGGRSQAGTTGIEFPIPEGTEVPEKYSRIAELEFTV